MNCTLCIRIIVNFFLSFLVLTIIVIIITVVVIRYIYTRHFFFVRREMSRDSDLID